MRERRTGSRLGESFGVVATESPRFCYDTALDWIQYDVSFEERGDSG